MIDRSESGFAGILDVIVDTHREAERNRRLWARIWAILALLVGALIGASWYSAAHAEPTKTYPGFKLAWDYTWAVPGDGFPIQVDGKWAAKAGVDAREIPINDLKLSDGPHRIEIRARAADGRVSPWAGIDIFYSSVMPDPLPAPDSMRIIMEWGTQ